MNLRYRSVRDILYARNPVLIALILFLSFHFSSFAQHDFAPGYIIKPNHDTVKGLIKSVPDADLSASVSFKTDMTGEWIQNGLSDLLGFGFENEIFRSIQFLNTSKGNIKDTVFARELVSGSYNLFTYSDNNERLFFLLQKDTTINLLYNDFVSSTNDLEQTGNYQNFLNFISISCDKLKNEYQRVAYNEKSISDFVQKTNNCISAGSSLRYYKNQKTVVTPIIFAGGLPVSSQRHLFTANLLVRLTFPRVNNHISLNIGLNYTSMNYMTSYNQSLNPPYRYFTHQQIESIPLTVQVNFTHSRIQPYVYAGFSAYYSNLVNLANAFYVQANEKGSGVSGVAGLGIEARIIAGLFIRAEWKYDVIVQYPAIGLSYHF
ncbi:MAG TPA: hypothetical protein VG101_07285 [Puia sp.]|jgi:hypothetical protein|nr:hypothetical protein [Puia sp.]